MGRDGVLGGLLDRDALPVVRVRRTPDGRTHLGRECSGEAETITVDRLDVDVECDGCGEAALTPEQQEAADETLNVLLLLARTHRVEEEARRARESRSERERCTVLGDVHQESVDDLHPMSRRLPESGALGRARSALVQRTGAVAAAATEDLRAERTREGLRTLWGGGEERTALVEAGRWRGLDRAVIVAYGTPTCSGRTVVSAPAAVLGSLPEGRALQVPDGGSAAALEVAAALWEPGGTGPLSRPESLLETARACSGERWERTSPTG